MCRVLSRIIKIGSWGQGTTEVTFSRDLLAEVAEFIARDKRPHQQIESHCP